MASDEIRLLHLKINLLFFLRTPPPLKLVTWSSTILYNSGNYFIVAYKMFLMMGFASLKI